MGFQSHESRNHSSRPELEDCNSRPPGLTPSVQQVSWGVVWNLSSTPY